MKIINITTKCYIKAGLLEHAAPNRGNNSSWLIVRLFRRYILGEGKETSRINLGKSQIACKALNGNNLTCPIDQVRLSWYEKRYFVPVNIISEQEETRVLMNKSSFLKNYEMTSQQQTIMKNVFAGNIYTPENFRIAQQTFNHSLYSTIPKKTDERENALEISKAEETLAQSDVGASKNLKTPNTTYTDMIARTVMRHPSKETRAMLEKLHQAIKTKFMNQTDEGLNWLLSPTIEKNRVRGGFANAQSLKKFLNKNPTTIPSSRLITGIETLLTDISYKSLFFPKGLTPNQKAIHKLCTQIKTKFAPCLDLKCPDKYDMWSYANTTFNPKTECSGGERGELSDVSDAESEHDMPIQERLPKQAFPKIKKDGNTRTWVYAAQLGNIPIRYSISGTACLNLAAAEWLLSDVKNISKELELLAGAVIIPTYHRADYHSVAEVMAGVQHQIDHRFKRDLALLQPQEALSRGLHLIAEATDPQFQDRIKLLSKVVIQSTTHVEYTSKKKN